MYKRQVLHKANNIFGIYNAVSVYITGYINIISVSYTHLDKAYISEMNKVFCSGYDIVTGYRNSKNYGDNMISAGYALSFLREGRFLN